MPTYQYACTECEHAFEQVQSFSEDSLTVCPQCQGRLRKIFNAVGVVFKGSGFYHTDSRADAKSRAESNGKANGTTKGTEAAGKSESSSSDSTAGSPAKSPAKSSAGSDASPKKKAGSTSAA